MPYLVEFSSASIPSKRLFGSPALRERRLLREEDASGFFARLLAAHELI